MLVSVPVGSMPMAALEWAVPVAAAAAAAAAAALSLQIPGAQFALNHHAAAAGGAGAAGGSAAANGGLYASPSGLEHLYVMMGAGASGAHGGRHGAPPTSAYGPQSTGILAPPPPSMTPTQLSQPFFQGECCFMDG